MMYHVNCECLELPRKVVRHTFTAEEDARLVELLTGSPSLSWSEIASCLPRRTARQCRERWAEYLRPGIRVEPWTEEEDTLLLRQVEILGSRWTAIAAAFARRSANDVKNRWYSHLRCCVFVRPDGRLEFMRACDGSRLPGKPKRRRKQTAPGQCAFAAVEMQRSVSQRTAAARPNRVWFPQLCPSDVERLVITEEH
jgi:hypothetical protein